MTTETPATGEILTAQPSASRRRTIVGALNEVALMLLVVLMVPVAILLLGAPFVLLGHAVAALIRLF
jgi:hypothetical protein